MAGDKILCLGCFNRFTPPNKRVKYCSKTCISLVDWEKAEARLLDTGADDKALEKHRRNHPSYRLKKVLLGNDKAEIESYTKVMQELRVERVKAGKIEPVTLDGLIERDKGICHLCGKKVGKREKFGPEGMKGRKMSNYPTIDHLLAISRGGTHTWDNVKLAHFSCNSKKGGRPHVAPTDKTAG